MGEKNKGSGTETMNWGIHHQISAIVFGSPLSPVCRFVFEFNWQGLWMKGVESRLIWLRHRTLIISLNGIFALQLFIGLITRNIATWSNTITSSVKEVRDGRDHTAQPNTCSIPITVCVRGNETEREVAIVVVWYFRTGPGTHTSALDTGFWNASASRLFWRIRV